MTDVGVEELEHGGVAEPPNRGSRRADSGHRDPPQGDPAHDERHHGDHPQDDHPEGDPGHGGRRHGDRHHGDRHHGDRHHGDRHHGDRQEIDPFDRPFLNPLTATIDLSGLRRRLAMEELGRIDFEPRLYGKPRDAAFDAEGTQIVPRPSAYQTPGRGLPAQDAREGLQFVDSDATRELHYGLHDLAVEGVVAEPARGADELTPSSAKSKAIWTLFDQVVSSGTNTLIGLIVARSVSQNEFGAFSVAFTLFALFIGLSRAGATSALGIRYSAAAPKVFHAAAAAGTGAGFAVGLVTGLAVVGAGTLIGGLVGDSLVAIGILFPGLLLQDAWRYVFFAQGRPSAAAANDVLWAVVQLSAVFILIARDVASASAMLLAWGGAAAVAAVVGVAQAGVWPAPERTREWLSEHREIFGFMSLEFIVVQGSQQASLLLIGALSSIETVGALRGVQILLGPTTVLAVGIVSFAIPELSRRKDMTAATRLRAAYALSLLVMGAGILWGILFVVLPDAVGASLLGDTWPAVHDILKLTIIQQAGAAATIGAACVMYSLGRAKLTFRANMLLSPQLILLPIIGLQLGGITGVVVGYVVAFWVPVPYWFHLLRRAVREYEEGQAERSSG